MILPPMGPAWGIEHTPVNFRFGKGPRHCRPCFVTWQAQDDDDETCWCCGEPGKVGTLT